MFQALVEAKFISKRQNIVFQTIKAFQVINSLYKGSSKTANC